jgi:hypothetical protein
LNRILWLCLAVFLCWALGRHFVNILRPGRNTPTDFFQDWASARNSLNQLPVYTSQRLTWGLYRDGRVGDEPPVWARVNAHPPTSVLLALPIASLQYSDAVFAWNLFSLMTLVGSLWLVIRQTDVRLSLFSIPPLLTCLLLCVPLWIHMYLGQLGLPLLLLITGAWAAERSGHEAIGGALLGVAAVLKLFPAFLFLYLIVRGRWRAVAAGVLSAAVLTLLTGELLGWAAFDCYLRDVLPRVTWFRSAWNNASIAGFWAKLFDPAPEVPGMCWRVQSVWQSAALARVGTVLTCVVLIGALGIAVARARTRAECDRAFGATIVGMLLVSPITWEHYFVLLLLPVVFGWMAFPVSPVARVGFLLSQIVLFAVPPNELHQIIIAGGAETGVATGTHTLTVLSLQFYALVCLFFIAISSVRTVPGQPGGGCA